MHVGLIVGIGPAATDLYYRFLISAMAARGVGLELTMAHADTPTLLRNQASGDARAQVAIYRRLTGRLQAAGAGAVAVTSIAGHFCIDAFTSVSPLPVIDMLVEVDREIQREGLRRVGILGTRVAMETGLYGAVRHAEILVPPADVLPRFTTPTPRWPWRGLSPSRSASSSSKRAARLSRTRARRRSSWAGPISASHSRDAIQASAPSTVPWCTRRRSRRSPRRWW